MGGSSIRDRRRTGEETMIDHNGHAGHAAPTTSDTAAHQTTDPSRSSHQSIYPEATRELAEMRSRLAPEPAKAFRAFSQIVFAEGALPAKTKQLIAVAVAHVTQCPYCIRSHTRGALRQGATGEEIMEAIWVAAEMRAGGAYAHSALALDTIAHETEQRASKAEEVASARETRSGANAESMK
jgi:AhpD family alkylhydroperoxidase